ncbi:MAG TPA: response regulator transcription factor [Terriglobia bacterium]|nr:response regulator transcription factor [Terriglobia bacterium]
MQILIIEDDEPVLSFLQRGLEAEQYEVCVASDGSCAKSLVDSRRYDLIILDLNLPGVDGVEVLKYVRSKDRRVPVLILSSRRGVEDRVRTLDLGADDFLPKPFAFSELCARTRALVRRSKEGSDAVLQVADLEFDRLKRAVRRGERRIDLTPKELALLQYLMENAGRCVTRTMIIENVWKLSPDTVSNVVDVYINYLRKKIDEGSQNPLIHTLRGSGYVIRPVAQNLVAAQGPAADESRQA